MESLGSLDMGLTLGLFRVFIGFGFRWAFSMLL